MLGLSAVVAKRVRARHDAFELEAFACLWFVAVSLAVVAGWILIGRGGGFSRSSGCGSLPDSCCRRAASWESFCSACARRPGVSRRKSGAADRGCRGCRFTRNMEMALKRTYAGAPDPKLVVAIGDCGCDGGIFGEGYASCGGVSNVIPVDVVVPDCPPPLEILRGILTAVRRCRPGTSVRP